MNIFKRLFSPSKEQDIDDSKNPWAGLASYEDPETAERKLKFCGRDDDSYDLARLIMGNVFVTLYGKSGIGKTSLLNAGVFPELRQEQFTPMSIRLGMRDEEHPQSYQTMIIEAIERIVNKVETINVIDEQNDQQAVDYLWNFFARHRFYDKDNDPTTPVIVFDQFEEVFRGYRDEAETLLRQLDYLNDKDHTLDSCEVNGQPYRFEQNFRFIVSIREDDLYRLEDSIDNCYLPALKRCRYRLRSLSEDSARDVILIPGEGLLKADEKDSIAEAIISKSRNSDGSISTNIISLLCSRIYIEFKKSAANHITSALVEEFIKGNPFERFYNEATRGFSNKEKSYIEEHLVDSTGRRNSIPESDFLKHVPKGKRLLEGDNRILQRTSTSSDGSNYRIELIHDSFCEPLIEKSKKRINRRRYITATLSIFSLLLIIVACLSYVSIYSANEKMKVNQARFIAEKVLSLVDEGDSYLARMLLMEVMPKNMSRPDKPYTIEAESALRRACHENKTILKGHTDNVNYASFSQDGRNIVSASDDKTIRVWDVQTGILLKTLEGHTDSVKSAAFSPNNKWIVSASNDNTIRMWDVETGMLTRILLGHTASVRSAYFSPDSKRIVSASWDYTVRIWDAQTGRELQKLEGHTDVVNSACFSSDGKRIVSASDDNTVRIWDAQTGNLLNILEGHTSPVRSALFSADCKKIVTVSDDHTVRIWDTQKNVAQQVLKGYTYFVYFASFSPDGKRIVTASYDNIVRIYDAQTGFCLKHLIGHTDEVKSATFSFDGKLIASASIDYTVRIWDAQPELLVKTLEGHTSLLRSASFSNDSKKIVSASFDNNIRVCDVQTGLLLRTLVGHTKSVNSVAFSPDGKRIVSASDDKTVRIWDAATGHLVCILNGHTNNVNSAFFSPDAKRIVSASSDNTIRVWDVETGKQLCILEGHTFWVKSASFSPDGMWIVSASSDKTVRIWDAAMGKQICILEGHTASVRSASFSPDGKRIVSASDDKTVRIWDAETGIQMGILEGHTNSVLFASFSPNGKLVVSASSDKTVRIWDVKTELLILSLDEHTKPVLSASFCSDGKYVVSASDNYNVRIWEFPHLQQLIDETRERFKNRQLTPEEQRKYYLDNKPVSQKLIDFKITSARRNPI